jgi:predicted membrane protein
MTAERAPLLSTRLIIGVFVMILGALLTLDNLDVFEADRYYRWWPLALVAIGLQKMFDSRERTRHAASAWFVIGAWMLGSNLGYIPFSVWALWPGAPILLLGAVLAWGALRPKRAQPATPASADDDVVNIFAFMGGNEVTNHSQSFRGGDLVAVMGGCGLDLRQSAIAEHEAKLQAFALMGGIEIKVPEGWHVVCRGVPVMAGIEDATKTPSEATQKRLVIDAVAIMGGIEVHN